MPFGIVFGQFDRPDHVVQILNHLKIKMYLICIFRLFFLARKWLLHLFIVEPGTVAVILKLGLHSHQPVGCMQVLVQHLA